MVTKQAYNRCVVGIRVPDNGLGRDLYILIVLRVALVLHLTLLYLINKPLAAVSTG
jgi:hypothetical protein